jgi:hypothetical protein
MTLTRYVITFYKNKKVYKVGSFINSIENINI